MDVTHVFHEGGFGFGGGVELLEVVDEGLSHGHQGLLGPGQEPIDCALVEQSRELDESVSEFLTHR